MQAERERVVYPVKDRQRACRGHRTDLLFRMLRSVCDTKDVTRGQPLLL